MNYRIYLLLISLASGIVPSVYAQMTAQLMKNSSKQTLHYWLYLPENYRTAPQQDFPLVLFLHGGGEVGDSLALVKKHGLPREIAQGKQFPFVMIAPQNPQDQLWDDALVLTLLNEVIDTHRIEFSASGANSAESVRTVLLHEGARPRYDRPPSTKRPIQPPEK